MKEEKSFTIYFKGNFEISAKDYDEAREMACRFIDDMKEVIYFDSNFNIEEEE